MASDKKADPDAIVPATAVEYTPSVVPRKRDKAAGFLATVSEDVTSFSYEEEKSVLRKIDRRVLPIILLAYFFQQLDKSSLSYVSIFGLSDDAHLVGQQYSWLGSILYLAQLVMQPLAAFLLVKLPTGKIIAVAIFFWGTSLTLMSACTNFPSLLGLRFCLGTFEAMIAPSCVAVTQMWWRRSEQTLRNSLWNGMNGVTAIVGSLLTYGLGSINTTALFKYQVRGSLFRLKALRTSYTLTLARSSSCSAVSLPWFTRSSSFSSCPTRQWRPNS